MAVHRAPQVTGRGRKLLLIVVPPVVLLAGAAMLFIAQPEEPVIPLDADLCPLDDAASPSAVLLLDLRKPLGDEAASLAAGALRDVTLQLARHTELRVFALTSNAGAPRLPVRRFCKPYANDDISVGSAKDGPATRDCDDLPAQLTAQTAENATRFCALRDQVGAEIQRLVERPLAIPVPNAYLVEAIEETSLAFAERTGARSLYVFSDMLQHAGWFSHAERGSQGWGFNDFIHMREVEEASVGPRPPPLDGVDATVYYIPRTGVTDAPRAKMNHMAFWRQYFTDALGAAPTFEELATLPDYPVEPLLNTLTEAEKLAQERKRLEAQSKRLERATAEYEAAQQRARQARQRAEAARQAQEEEAARQAAEAAEEAERQAEAAEAARRAAEDAARDEPAPPAPTRPPDIAQAEEPPAQTPAAQGAAREAAQQAAQEPAQPPAPAESTPEVAVEPAATEPVAAGDAADPAPGTVAPQPVAAAPQTPPPALPSLAPDLAAAPDEPQSSFCAASLQERFQNTNAYPIANRRLNLGAADIAVEFVVDEQGQTVDETVRVVVESSTATRPNYFDAFADEARNVAQGWVFDFNAADTECVRTQTVRARVKFKY